MQDFEKLGAFYLGKVHDLDLGITKPDLLLYDSKDLTTHAVCVGMTGSGKTGLCLSLLEEAGIDGVPAIVIDPKGDLGNLLLTFPDLDPADFRPWIDEGVATRKAMTPDEFAAKTAKTWKEGLASWGQDGARIAKLRETVDLAIYTPGSNAGLPLTVLRSFDAPPQCVVDDSDAFRERVASAASGLLALLGMNVNPVQSREHILVSNLFDRAWREGRNLDLAGLIAEIQSPPFERIGIMELETFFPSKDRMELSMTLNNLLASPSFARWMDGDPLDVKRLLYTPTGKPRISIISIAHLSDAERMFMVTILLNEVLTWMRGQPGTSSLRALLYMDEVYGYFPPTANPPSKIPMLTLLKQARAFGLGVVLATQNPVDLDYKGLSNCGTWFLGRLQTERDKARMLDGLEGASAQTGGKFDRSKMERILSSLGSRKFLMNNVHDDEPVIFETRWAMSYLRGPLTRTQIQSLTSDRPETTDAATTTEPVRPAKEKMAPPPAPTAKLGSVPKSIDAFYLRVRKRGDGRLVYRPALLGRGRLHFVRSTYKTDCWEDRAFLVSGTGVVDEDVWDAADSLAPDELDLLHEPDSQIEFSPLPSEMTKASSYKSWTADLKKYLYRTQRVTVFKCAELKQYSTAGEAEDDFRIRLSQHASEARDLATEKLRKRYATKLASAKSKIETAEERIGREKSQFRQRSFETMISFGTGLLGALFGRKLTSSTNVTRASTSMRSLGRAARERGDVGRAEEDLEIAQDKLKELEAQFENDLSEVEDKLRADALELETLEVTPRKSDISIESVAVVWAPWRVDSMGIAEPIY